MDERLEVGGAEPKHAHAQINGWGYLLWLHIPDPKDEHLYDNCASLSRFRSV